MRIEGFIMRNNQYVDTWYVDRICAQHYQSLKRVDLSYCKKMTVGAVSALARCPWDFVNLSFYINYTSFYWLHFCLFLLNNSCQSRGLTWVTGRRWPLALPPPQKCQILHLSIVRFWWNLKHHFEQACRSNIKSYWLRKSCSKCCQLQ